MEDLLKAIKDEKPTEIKTEFDKLISSRIMKNIEDKKVELAKKIFDPFPSDKESEEE